MRAMKLFCAVIMTLICSTVFADNTTVSVKDKDGNELTVAPGETVDLYVWFDYSSATLYDGSEWETCALTPYITINLSLPEGFEFVGDPAISDVICNYPETEEYKGSNGNYLLKNDAHESDGRITATSGALVKFQIKATSAEASETPYTGSLSRFHITDENYNEVYGVNQETDEPVSFNIYVKEATAESEDITLANTDSYNSYCSTKDLDFSEVTTAEAYVVTAVSATEATLAKVTAVPAGEGFLILGKGEASISVPVAAEKPAATGTLLVGVTTATEIEEGNFGLATDGSKFVPLLAGIVPANKAYLPASAAPELGAKEFMLVIDGIEVTGISEIQTESKANGAIYNLNGARVSAPQKGVYIMNGRKVIVK